MWLLKLKSLLEMAIRYRWGILGAALFLFGYTVGAARIQADLNVYRLQVERDHARLSAAVADAKAASSAATTQVVERYVDRWRTVTVRGETLIKEVPKYVTAADDSRCVVPDSFRLLWEAANGVDVPEPSSISDGAPRLTILEASDAPVRLSDIAAAHATESLICNQNYEQVLGLQDWIRTQQCAVNHECSIKPGP